MDWIVAATGAATGLLVGLTGVGSGALMTPLLLLVFGVAPLTAVGTDLWFAAITKLAATRIHHGRGLIDWEVARRLWTGSLPGAAIAIVAMKLTQPHAANPAWLTLAIGTAVVVSSIGMLAQKRLHQIGRRVRTTDAARFKAMQGPLTVAAGAALGALVTVTSIGAGALGAVMLLYLYPLRLTPPRLVATDIVHAIPLAVFAGLGHLVIGNVNLTLLGNLLLGSIPGVIAGAVLSARLPHVLLRVTIALALLVIGLRLAWTSGIM